MKRLVFTSLLSFLLFPAIAQTANEEKAILQVIHQFFAVLENQDSTSFRDLHLTGARFYIVREENSTVRTAVRDVLEFTFNKDQVIKERMRDSQVAVQVHGRIATVWAPYDLWINDVFSHCGVDVFTLLKTSGGWRIANCSYTVEKLGCGNVAIPKS